MTKFKSLRTRSLRQEDFVEGHRVLTQKQAERNVKKEAIIKQMPPEQLERLMKLPKDDNDSDDVVSPPTPPPTGNDVGDDNGIGDDVGDDFDDDNGIIPPVANGAARARASRLRVRGTRRGGRRVVIRGGFFAQPAGEARKKRRAKRLEKELKQLLF